MVNFYEAMVVVKNGGRVRTNKMAEGDFVCLNDGMFEFWYGGTPDGSEVFSVHDFYFDDEWSTVFDNKRYTVMVQFEAQLSESDIFDSFGSINIKDVIKKRNQGLIEFLNEVAETIIEERPSIVVIDSRTGKEEFSM